MQDRGFSPRLARSLRSAAYAVTGKGAGFIERKRRYHRERADAVRDLLDRDGGAMAPNLCPACGGASIVRSFENGLRLRFSVCGHDGMVYMNPVLTEAALGALYNHAAYMTNWSRGDGPRITLNPDDRDALLRMAPSLPRPARLLDVGCSTGGFLKSASDRFEVEGVEINDNSAGIARNHGYAVKTGRLRDVEGESRFDVITMLQLIEHLVDPASELAEVRRLLKPNGVLFINTPAADSGSFLRLQERHSHVGGFGHVSLFTRKALDELARRCGFEVVAQEYWGGTDFALHDYLTLSLTPTRFRHRMAGYSPRLYYALESIEVLLPRRARVWQTHGPDSYARFVLRPKSAR